MIPPRISIVVPCFNQATFLVGALDSIAEQRYPHTELIVVDGGSSDATRELLQRRSDVVTRWVSEPDRGQTHALNKGFALATGSIRGWLNCDERYRPGALWVVANAFVNEPDLDIVFGHRIIVDEQRSEIGRARLPNLHPAKYALFASGLLFSDTTFWTADLHARTGELNELDNPRYGMDFEWFARISHHVKRWKRLDTYLSEFTQHAARVTYDVPEMPDIARKIRLQILERSAMPRWVVACISPFYLARTHYERTGARLFTSWPSLRSVLRVAGYVR